MSKTNIWGSSEKDVMLQDQASNGIIFRFNQEVSETVLSSATALFDRTITVDDSTDITVGEQLTIIDPDTMRGFFAVVTDITSAPEISIDRPLDYAFPVSSYVLIETFAMAIDGSTTEQVFKVRVPEDYDLDIDFDITQLRLLCQTESAVSIEKFGDQTALTNGLTIRKKNSDGTYRNLLTVKSNGEIYGAFGTWIPMAAANPGLDEYGFFSEWRQAGQQNQGTVIRLEKGSDLQIVFNEDLSALTILEAVVIGHIVED